VPIAIFTNALRVSGTGVLAHYYGTQVADGFFHSFSGWVIYIVAFLLLFTVGWILERFRPSPSDQSKPGSRRAKDVSEDPKGASVSGSGPAVQAEGTE
jgi:hypothetical protein